MSPSLESLTWPLNSLNCSETALKLNICIDFSYFNVQWALRQGEELSATASCCQNMTGRCTSCQSVRRAVRRWRQFVHELSVTSSCCQNMTARCTSCQSLRRAVRTWRQGARAISHDVVLSGYDGKVHEVSVRTSCCQDMTARCTSRQSRRRAVRTWLQGPRAVSHSVLSVQPQRESNVQPQHARQPPCLCGHLA